RNQHGAEIGPPAGVATDVVEHFLDAIEDLITRSTRFDAIGDAAPGGKPFRGEALRCDAVEERQEETIEIAEILTGEDRALSVSEIDGDLPGVAELITHVQQIEDQILYHRGRRPGV